jgi:hypothetical protein
MTHLNYSEQFGMAYTGLGNMASYQFRVNSIFDPNYTGTGHQPLGHDQWATFYNRYRVRKMTYRITFTNFSGSEESEVALEMRPNSTIGTSYDTVREGPLCVYKSILGIAGSNNAIRETTGVCDIAKIRGIDPRRVLLESDFQAVFGNNPPIECFLNIAMQNQDVGTAVTIRVRVDLTYHVDLFDRKIQTAS